MRVGIKHRSRYDENNRQSKVWAQIGAVHAPAEDLGRVHCDHLACDQQRSEHSEATEDNFLRPHSDQQQRLGLEQPEHRQTHAGIAEGECRNQQNHAQRAEHDDRAATPPSDRQLSQQRFDRSNCQQRPERPLRVRRLVLEQRQQQRGIQQGRRGGDVLLPLVARPPEHIRHAEDQPVQRQDSRTRGKFRKRMPFPMHRFDDRPQPQIMIQIAGQDSEHFQLEPLHAQYYDHQPRCQHRSRRQAVHVRVTDRDRQERKQKCEPGHHLRAITQSVHNHRRCHCQHEHQVEGLRRKHLRRRNVIHRVGRKEEECPTASNSCARQYPVTFPTVKPDPRAQQHASSHESHQNFARGTERLKLVGKKERDT